MTQYKPAAKHGIALLTLSDLDPATPGYAAAVSLHDQVMADLGDDLSTAERQLVQRFSMLGSMLADIECKWLKGEPTDPAHYCTVINAQLRCAHAIGLKRRQKRVRQSILRPERIDESH